MSDADTAPEILNPDNPLSSLPADYEHCVNVYKAMAEVARPRIVEDVELSVYEGTLTKLFNKLGLSTPYYTRCMADLKRMRCVEQLRRGGGGAPSLWVLHYCPTPDIWRNTEHRRGKNKQSKTASLEQKVADHNVRLNKVEAFIDQLKNGAY